MSATRPRRTRKPSPNHEFKHHGYIRGTSSEEPAPTGVLYIFNALAFSTLLSSQETDALRVSELSFRPSRRLFKFTRFFLLVKSAAARFIRTVKPDLAFREFPSHQHTGSFGVVCTHTKLRRDFLLVAPRVRARLPAFPPPRGKKNLTGLSHHRQIVPDN
jgi:hypothetical protein